jgi:hypothetical protein
VLNQDIALVCAKGLLLSSFILVAATKPLFAEGQGGVHPYLTDTFSVDLGVYFPERQLRIRVDGPTGGPGDLIDFQSELKNTRSDEIFSLNIAWHFGEKWQLGGQYFNSKGSRESVLENDVEWGGFVIGAGSSISAGQEFTLNRIFFGRDFSIKKRHEFGIGAGLHWLELGAYISGNIIDGSGGVGPFRTESVSASAPLPNIGAWYVYSISPKWAFKSRLDWLSASVGDYDGRLINASLGVNYQVFKNAGIGASYNVFDLNVGVKKSDWYGQWDMTYRGPYAHLSFFW